MTVKEQLVQAVLDLDELEAICAEIAVDQDAVEEEKCFNRMARASTKRMLQALDEEEREAGCRQWQR